MRRVLGAAGVVALALTLAGCGGSSRTHVTSPAKTRPASAATRAAIVNLMHQTKEPPGITLHVWSVRVAASDPHFARAFVGLTGGPYGGGKGDTAFAVAMEVGGHWTVVVGPGTGFVDECHRPTVAAIAALLCS